jgi:ATP-dependent helicase/nuclease subunit A
MPEHIGHTSISASAGSGKTFRLAHRYIRLMALGVPPDRINALTFSRKAAGEIFDSIVNYLREAAESDSQAAETAGEIGLPDTSREDFLVLLRKLLDFMHRLNTGTLDSFTIKVVQAFPMELGIGLDFQIMDNGGSEAAAEQLRVLQHIFRPGGINPKASRDFFQAFKQSTFGDEEKTITEALRKFIANKREWFMRCSDPERWGNHPSIWADRPPWMEPPRFAPEDGERIKAAIEDSAIPANPTKDFIEFINFASDYRRTKEWPEKLFGHVAMKRLFEQVQELSQGPVTMLQGKKSYVIPADIAGYLYKLVIHVMTMEYGASLEQTRGMFQVLRLYEEVYDRMVRRRGRLTFDDAQYLLTPGNENSPNNQLSADKGAENRLYIDYRLNARLDHWLLDEFQDTSDAQWAAFQNLIDEVVQDQEGQRSFFYVGDVKQAIYRWRGGNTRLFNEIRNQYGDKIAREDMSTSYRSCPAVLAMVNAVFDNLNDAQGLPADAIMRWNEVYHKHISAKQQEKTKGYCALVEPMEENGPVKDVDRYDVVAGLLKEIKPLDRGLSVAILTRTNWEGENIARHLREDPICQKMRIVREGVSPILDDPLSALMVNLLRYASHPGNTLAKRHIEMSPLMPLLEEQDRTLDALALDVLDGIYDHGFRETLRSWLAELLAVIPASAYADKRARELLQAASEFDAGMRRDVDEFVRFIESYRLREIAASAAVRIMTIHTSKGLGFDMVILPELMGDAMKRARAEELVTARGEDGRTVEWILKMPRSFLVACDPALSAEAERQNAEHCFDELCVLYVAMTRAKQGMYLVTSPPRTGKKHTHHAKFIESRLHIDREEPRETDLPGRQMLIKWEVGQPGWYADRQAKAPEVIEPDAAALASLSHTPSHRVRLSRLRPSDIDHAPQKAGALFEIDLRERADYGTAIHGLFEEITWLDQTKTKDAIARWRTLFPLSDELDKELVDEFMKVLDDLECRSLLSSTQVPCELWREQEFEIVLNQQWITGVIDRAVIAEDKSFAEIIDFKSNRMPLDHPEKLQAALQKAADGYRSQLHLYRRALSLMMDIPEDRISLKLLFTHPARVVTVE